MTDHPLFPKEFPERSSWANRVARVRAWTNRRLAQSIIDTRARTDPTRERPTRHGLAPSSLGRGARRSHDPLAPLSIRVKAADLDSYSRCDALAIWFQTARSNSVAL